VLEAGDPVSAIDHIDNNLRLAVIVSDLDMARWIFILNHARVTLPTAIVLTIAGYSSMASVAETQKLGARGYFKSRWFLQTSTKRSRTVRNPR